MGEMKRVLQEVMNDPKLRRDLFVRVIIATQAREGIETTQEQAEKVYDKIHKDGNLKGVAINDYA